MATYTVYVPFTGYCTVEVEADNEEEAIQKALDEADINDPTEWEATRKIVQGNVFSGVKNEIEVELE